MLNNQQIKERVETFEKNLNQLTSSMQKQQEIDLKIRDLKLTLSVEKQMSKGKEFLLMAFPLMMLGALGYGVRMFYYLLSTVQKHGGFDQALAEASDTVIMCFIFGTVCLAIGTLFGIIVFKKKLFKKIKKKYGRY